MTIKVVTNKQQARTASMICIYFNKTFIHFQTCISSLECRRVSLRTQNTSRFSAICVDRSANLTPRRDQEELKCNQSLPLAFGRLWACSRECSQQNVSVTLLGHIGRMAEKLLFIRSYQFSPSEINQSIKQSIVFLRVV